jgi:hypothetical protein
VDDAMKRILVLLTLVSGLAGAFSDARAASPELRRAYTQAARWYALAGKPATTALARHYAKLARG